MDPDQRSSLIWVHTVYKKLLFITKVDLFKYTENFTTKTESFLIKNSDIFILLLKTKIAGTRSNEYTESMFLAEYEKKYFPVNPLYYITMRFKGVKII